MLFKLWAVVQPRLVLPSFGRFIFLRGGAYNAAIARMLLAVSLWYSLHHAGTADNWDYYLKSLAAWGWVPKGLVKILSHVLGGPPSQDFVIGLQKAGYVAIAMMFVGLFSRLSTIAAALITTLYASLMVSFGPFWSHALNVQLLAALIFMFGRSGDRLSVDDLLRRLAGMADPVPKHDGRYWWPVLFAELATHMFMWGAFFQKMRNGNGIWWALSDNLRNSLAISWGHGRFDPPAAAEWFMSNPWIYKTGGLLQLAAQGTTIFAILLVRRPVARAILGGLFFFMEIMGLTHLFSFWHPFWVPLCLLSIDWEWLWGVIRRKMPALPADRSLPPLVRTLWIPRLAPQAIRLSRAYRAVVYAFAAVFFGYYTANIVFSLGEKHLNFPFSSMAFYSENRDIPPYDVPGYFPLYRGWVELTETGSTRPLAFAWHHSDILDAIMRAEPGEAQMRAVHASIRTRYGERDVGLQSGTRLLQGLGEIRTYRQIVAVPPVPRPALPLVDLHSGLLSVEDAKGFRTIGSALNWDEASQRYVVSLRPHGFLNPSFRILARKNVREEPKEVPAQPLPGEWIDSKFYLSNTHEPTVFVYTLIEVTDPVLGIVETYAGPENFQTHR
ncbi:hypothetical protein ACWIGM_28840 [Bosea sp. NPDC055332]